MTKLIIFGASQAGKNALKAMRGDFDIIGFCDNDPMKRGTRFCDLPVWGADDLVDLNWSRILIASCYAEEIYAQLLAMGVSPDRVEFSKAPPNLEHFAQWKTKHVNRLSRFKNRHASADCFIIGNGPSLNLTNLGALNQFYSFGLNKIFLMFERSPFRPTYHVAINSLVIEQSAHELEDYAFPSFVSYASGKSLVEASERLFFIHTAHTYAFSADATEAVIEGNTVTYAAMQLAYFMGFDRVFLIGVDHSFSASGKPHEKQKMGETDPNHFDPRYFANQDWHLPDLEGSAAFYRLAKDAFEADGRMIYDATIGGKLDVFPKLDFEEALKMAQPRV